MVHAMKLEDYRYFIIQHSADEISTFSDDTDRLCWNESEKRTNRFIGALNNVGARYIFAAMHVDHPSPSFGSTPNRINILGLDDVNYLKLALLVDEDEMLTSFPGAKPITLDSIGDQISEAGRTSSFVLYGDGEERFSWTPKQMRAAGYGLTKTLTEDQISSIIEAMNQSSVRQAAFRDQIMKNIPKIEFTTVSFLDVDDTPPNPIAKTNPFKPSTGIKAFKSPPRPDTDPLESPSWIEKMLKKK